MLVTFLHPAADADDWRQVSILGSVSGLNTVTKRGATCMLEGVKKIWENVPLLLVWSGTRASWKPFSSLVT